MKYEKPMVVVNEGISEGVFASSGVNPECYSVTTNIHQFPQQGRGDYRIQVNAKHNATDGHHSTEQILTLCFNQPVEYVGSNGSLLKVTGNILQVKYNYHNNSGDNVGLGDVIVTSDVGLAVITASLSCNHTCGQHM